MHKIIRLVMVAVITFSASMFGQQSRKGYITADQDHASVPVADDEFNDGFHSNFERLEQSLGTNLSADQSSHESPAGTGSAEQLRHPLSGNAKRLIETGQKFAQAGDHERAIDEFRRALDEPPAVPYTRSLWARKI